MSNAYMNPENTPDAMPFICCSDKENSWNIMRRPAVDKIIAIITSLSIDSLSNNGASIATKIGAV
jgi:hypothetical protein